MDETNAAYLSSVFWGAMVVGRLAAVFLSTKISAHRLLSLDMTGSIVSIAMLLLFDSLRREIVLWIVSIGFGLFMASIYATAFSLPREMDINVTSTSTSILIVFSSLGDMGLPVVAGWLITHLKPQALIWMILCVFLVAVCIYGFILLLWAFLIKDNTSKNSWRKIDLDMENNEAIESIEM